MRTTILIILFMTVHALLYATPQTKSAISKSTSMEETKGYVLNILNKSENIFSNYENGERWWHEDTQFVFSTEKECELILSYRHVQNVPECCNVYRVHREHVDLTKTGAFGLDEKNHHLAFFSQDSINHFQACEGGHGENLQCRRTSFIGMKTKVNGINGDKIDKAFNHLIGLCQAKYPDKK